jgi:hypothetical protein
MPARSASDSTPIASREADTVNHHQGQEPKAESLRDREERAVAALLTRFKNLVSLAAMPAVDGATKEAAAADAFQMEVESSALVCPAESRSRVDN